jgi:hypothetical protein
VKKLVATIALLSMVPGTAGAWSRQGTHAEQTQLALQWIADHDPEGRYAWLYARRYHGESDSPAFYNPRLMGEEIVPGDTDHPAIIGSHAETIRRPGMLPGANNTEALNFALHHVTFGALAFEREFSHYGLGVGIEHSFGLSIDGMPDPDELFRWHPDCTRDPNRFPAADVWALGDGTCDNTLGFLGAVDVFRHGTRQAVREAVRRLGHVAHVLQELGQPDNAAGVPNFMCSDIGEGSVWTKAIGFVLDRIMFNGAHATAPEDYAEGSPDASNVLKAVGFNAYVALAWRQIAPRLGLGSLAPLRSDTYFDFMADAASDASALVGGRRLPLGCANPGLQVIDPGAPNVDWRDLAVALNQKVVMRTVGLLQQFYELVNPPPHVAQMMAFQGAAGGLHLASWNDVLEDAPELKWGKKTVSTGGLNYISHTVDYIVPKVLRRRELVSTSTKPLTAGLPATLRVRFAPNTIAPKRMSRVAGRFLGETLTFTRLSRTSSGEWWTATVDLPCQVSSTTASLALAGRDAEAHQGSRDFLDGNPATVAFVGSAGSQFGEAIWQGYEPGETWFDDIAVRNPTFTALVEKAEVTPRTGGLQTEAYVLRQRNPDSPADQAWQVSVDVTTDAGTAPAGNFGRCIGLSWTIDPKGLGPDGRSVYLASAGLNVRGAWSGSGGRVSATPSASTPLGGYTVFVTARSSTSGLSKRFAVRFKVVQPVVIPEWPRHLP